MNNNVSDFIRLVQENPKLPVVPMVDYEVVAGDECARWIGDFGKARVMEYYCSEEHVYYKDDEDIKGAVSAAVGWERYEAISDEEANDIYEKLPWIKAIIVNIDTP